MDNDKIIKGMPEETQLYDLAELFKVFGDSTRIRILYVLSLLPSFTKII